MKYLNKGSKAIQILCVLKHVEDVIYINKRSKATLNTKQSIVNLVRDVRDVKNLNKGSKSM